jgi:hypothetical protein
MAQEAPTTEPKSAASTKQANARMLDRFLELTGYEEDDVIGSNFKSRTFVTSNGGKYEMNKAGKVIKVVAGPNPPDEDALIERGMEAGENDQT